MKTDGTAALLPSRREMERAFAERDPGYDGVFFVAVRTTGIFCRPSCPSRPRRDNLEFLPSIRACLGAGYRPCKRCRPTEVDGSPPEWVEELMRKVAASPESRWTAEELRAAGVAPERARRWFQEHHRMSFAAWCRAHRLAGAFRRLREGAPLDDAGFAAGYESTSGFRDAFARVFGNAPGRAAAVPDPLIITTLDSPVGPLLAGVRDAGVGLLEFADHGRLEGQLEGLRRHGGGAPIPGDHPLLDRLRSELAAYFQGRRREFSLPIALAGTPFQIQVWEELRRIPFGATLSYEDLARRVGRPTGQRAVAQANGLNRVAILVPCHRVIGKDGELTGYGGGLWRKRLLLELERTGQLPGDDGPAGH